ncbi:MAG: hypothetical protein H8D45_03620 [Bacteroidetes bacterium]|nr:hypothetical protein [Bacteroidota bacterium]
MKASELKVGDVAVIVWHDAAEYQEAPKYYKPGNIGFPGIRQLITGIVVTNENGWLRLAEKLTYFREGETEVNIRNTYFEMPWSWIDAISQMGSVLELLEDVWEKAK